MSSYNGRRGPNVSQYIANLNAVPSQQEPLNEPTNAGDEFDIFMNTDFFDNFDAATGNVDLNALPGFDLDANERAAPNRRTNTHDRNNNGAAQTNMDFNLNSDFQFADFSNFANPINIDPLMQNPPHSQPNSYPIPPPYTSPVSSAVSPVAQGFEQPAGKKRKLEHADPNSQQAIDDAARIAAEEDKRRRNTAASARFRIKKKQREQALEKQAKEASETVKILETRIQQLETENTWLKGLITEKSGGKASASEIKAILSKHEESNVERSNGNRTDGVGTKAEDSKA